MKPPSTIVTRYERYRHLVLKIYQTFYCPRQFVSFDDKIVNLKSFWRNIDNLIKVANRYGSGCDAIGRAFIPTPEVYGRNPVIGNFLYHQIN